MFSSLKVVLTLVPLFCGCGYLEDWFEGPVPTTTEDTYENECHTICEDGCGQIEECGCGSCSAGRACVKNTCKLQSDVAAIAEIENIQFGLWSPGYVGSREVVIASAGVGVLEVYGVSLTDSLDGSLEVQFDEEWPEPNANAPWVLQQGNSATFTVTFNPNPLLVSGESNVVFQSAIALNDNTGAVAPHTVAIVAGTATSESTPIAAIEVDNPLWAVPPGTILQLDASSSQVVDDQPIQAWQWNVTNDEGDTGSFEPSDQAESPLLILHAVGHNELSLSVTDAAGRQCSEPATYSVFVSHNDADELHEFVIVLSWSTPSIPDPVILPPDDLPDLDLHLVHPFANGPDKDGDGQPDGWFDISYDCYHFNPAPNWGSYDPLADDDPHLVGSPAVLEEEQLQYNAPENISYKIGVHYRDDRGHGTSLASLQVFAHGKLLYSVQDQPLDKHDMWEVCVVNWAEKVATASTGDNDAPMITANYLPPFENN